MNKAPFPQWHRFILSLCAGIFAADAAAILTVSQPWVRLSADRRSADVYMDIKSSEGATLIGADTFAAAAVSIKSPATRNHAATEIPLAAKTTVKLAPAGSRIALARLTKPLKLGDLVPISLKIRSADGSVQEILVIAEVRRHSAQDDELRPHKH